MNAGLGYRPVVALDLDGVLRIPEPHAPAVAPTGVFSVEITMRRADYPTYMHREPDWDEHDQWTATHWLSTVGAAWARDLVQREITVVWATSWQTAANKFFAEPLGLPQLAVATRESERWAPDPATWNSLALSRQFDGRPLLWVDDYPTTSPSMALPMLRLRTDRVLTRCQRIRDWELGISEKDVAEMDEWLKLASSPEGHAELRRRRRRHLDRRRAQCQREGWGSQARYRQWRTIQRRLDTALGQRTALAGLLADHALEHPHLDPVRIADLVSDWGDDGTPPVPDLIRIIRSENREDT